MTIFRVLILIFLVLLTATLLLNFSPTSAYKYLRLLFYILLAVTLSTLTFSSRRLVSLGRFLAASVLIQSVLGLYQFITQRSLCGYLCLGETTLSPLSYGITRDFLGSLFLILPYGTFPHPNILGGFLAVALPILVFGYFLTKQRRLLLVVYLAFLVLLLTKSPVTLLVGLTGLLLVVLNPWSRLLSRRFNGFLIWFPASWLTAVSFWRRLQLADFSLKMIMDKPWTGVGLNNFIPSLPLYGYISGWPEFLQPVHNIYLLIAAEMGIPALVTFLLSVICFLMFLIRSHRYLLVLTTIQLLALGLWDHYLWTTPQGLLMLWLTLGIGLSTLKTRHETL